MSVCVCLCVCVCVRACVCVCVCVGTYTYICILLYIMYINILSGGQGSYVCSCQTPEIFNYDRLHYSSFSKDLAKKCNFIGQNLATYFAKSTNSILLTNMLRNVQ